MATPIKMPDLGTTVEVVTLVAWLKQVGEPVKRGEALCEVETDKATDQLESVAAGVLLRHVVPAKSEVRSGTVIAYIGSPGEVIPEASVASADVELKRPRLPKQARRRATSPAEGAAGDPQSGQTRGREPRCGRRHGSRRPNHPRRRAPSEADADECPRGQIGRSVLEGAAIGRQAASRAATARFPPSI